MSCNFNKNLAIHSSITLTFEGGCVKTIIQNDKTIKFKHVVEIRD
jgi:hypothetical protein